MNGKQIKKGEEFERMAFIVILMPPCSIDTNSVLRSAF